jgi:cytoskeletal protein CcmA (bactofilin family)
MSREVGAVIGREVTIRGEIECHEDLLIQGTIDGRIESDAELIVGVEGIVRAEVVATLLTVEGTLDGEIDCSERMRLADGSHTTGVIRATRIVIDEGAVFTGTLEMDVGFEAETRGGANG